MEPASERRVALTLITIVLQVRSISMMAMVFATAPLGLIGVTPTLLLFNQPFGINALVGLIALSGILMRNTLILIGQMQQRARGMDALDAVVEATVQRSRPVILTALAAMLAFIPLTHSVFWGALAYTLIGGTFGGTVLTLVFCLRCTPSGSRSGRRPVMSESFLRCSRSLSHDVPMMMPIGRSRFGFVASSAVVDTASKPR